MGAKDQGFGWQEPTRHCYILNIYVVGLTHGFREEDCEVSSIISIWNLLITGAEPV